MNKASNTEKYREQERKHIKTSGKMMMSQGGLMSATMYRRLGTAAHVCRAADHVAAVSSCKSSSCDAACFSSRRAAAPASLLLRTQPAHAVRPYSATAGAFQYYGGGGGGGGAPGRAFPSYSIFGADALLTLKPLLPTFKPAGGDGVALDRRGKMMLSFTPLSASASGGSGTNSGGGSWLWQEQLTIALTVEEVGLLVNQLPTHEVEISRAGSNNPGRGGGEYSLAEAGAEVSDAPDKVLTAAPGEGATVSFTLDFVRDGVGAQLSPLDDNSRHAPLTVVAQAGDFEVFRRLMEASIPQLLGWNTMMDIGVQSMIHRSGSGGGGGGYGGGAGRPY
jgi:hypothetical protein